MSGTSPEVQLARIEGGRLVRNPLLWLSFVPLVLWVRAVEPAAEPESVHFVLVGYGLVVPGFVLFAQLVVAVLRSRTAGADELLDALPVGRDRRSLAHGLSTLVAGAVGALAVGVAYLAFRPGGVVGTMGDVRPSSLPVPRPGVAQLLQGPLALIVWCALGLALARWLPSWVVILAFVLPSALQFTWFGTWNGVPVSAVSWLLPLANGMVAGDWQGCGPDDSLCVLEVAGFDRVTPWWHLGYLAALATLFVTVAVLRNRRDGRAWASAGGALAAVIVLGLVQALVYEPYVAAAGR